MKSDEEIKNAGEVIDRLISIPLSSGATLTARPALLDLYQAAREKFKNPLSYLAVDGIMNRVKKGDAVLLLTGFIVPPWFRPEHDGPAGAITLARALDLGLDATPIIVAETAVNQRMKALGKACGFEVTDYDEAKRYPRRIALEDLSLDDDIAKRKAKNLLDATNPSVIIAIEKASPNEKGVYHSGVGYDITAIQGKVSYLIEEAKKRGIFTIGIGDGGNEVGMGCIKETVKKVLRTGSKCGCPCGAGTHSDIATDLLIVAMVSNWGAYALEALLAIAIGKSEVMHDKALEDKVFEAAASAGFIDPIGGFGMAHSDRIDKSIHLAIVDILNYIVKSKITDNFYLEKYKEYEAIGREAVQENIKDWAVRVRAGNNE